MFVTIASAREMRRRSTSAPPRGLEIDRDAALVAVGGRELPAHAPVPELAGIAPLVAGEPLDLDEIGAPVAQRLGAERPKRTVVRSRMRMPESGRSARVIAIHADGRFPAPRRSMKPRPRLLRDQARYANAKGGHSRTRRDADSEAIHHRGGGRPTTRREIGCVVELTLGKQTCLMPYGFRSCLPEAAVFPPHLRARSRELLRFY